MVGEVKKAFCINECTFLVNSDCEVFFCGRHSLKSTVFSIQNNLRRSLDKRNSEMTLRISSQSLDQPATIM